MIPKKIHYCWFGGNPLGEKEKKCIESWKKFCPDYEIKEWNESNFDIDLYPYLRQAYDNKKYAFLTDVVRLDIIYREGGIYFDTDVEIIKNIDSLLDNEAFFAFEDGRYVATGLGFGAVAGNKIVKANRDLYENVNFVNEDGTFNLKACPKYTTELMLEYGLKQDNTEQVIANGVKIYPSECFNPYDYLTDKLNKTPNTYTIHWFANSWSKQRNPIMKFLLKYYHRIMRIIK